MTMNYDFREGKKRVLDILTSKTCIETKDSIPNDEQFTYENGIKAWVGALFVDIKDSTNLFKNGNVEKIARMMRAFCKEIIGILKDNDNYRQIGIRGDCVYAIYSISKQNDLEGIFSDAVTINSFQIMFQRLLRQNNFPTFEIGIGLGASQDLVIKAGFKNTGIRDYIWIGNAVVDASKLSSQGNRNGFKSIVLDSTFYENIKNYDANEHYKYCYYIAKKYSLPLHEIVYHCDMIDSDFDNWINEGMRN